MGYLCLPVLLAGWIYFTWAIVSLSLDYSIRRAGESAEFPPRDSAAFYWNCALQTGNGVFVASLYYSIPAYLAFSLSHLLFPRLRGWRYWLIGFACVVLPPCGWAVYEIWTSRFIH